jgi:hypothetical protein
MCVFEEEEEEEEGRGVSAVGWKSFGLQVHTHDRRRGRERRGGKGHSDMYVCREGGR